MRPRNVAIFLVVMATIARVMVAGISPVQSVDPVSILGGGALWIAAVYGASMAYNRA